MTPSVQNLQRHEILHRLRGNQEGSHRVKIHRYSSLHPHTYSPPILGTLPDMTITHADDCCNKTAPLYICTTRPCDGSPTSFWLCCTTGRIDVGSDHIEAKLSMANSSPRSLYLKMYQSASRWKRFRTSSSHSMTLFAMRSRKSVVC